MRDPAIEQSETSVRLAGSTPVESWRMWVLPGVMMLCSVLSYVDRQTLAVLSPMVLRETGLNAQSYAMAVSCFSFAYMIANPLWGSALDYVGLRIGMLFAVTVWTMASVSHAWASGFLGFAVARTLLGLGEGATFPGGLRTSTETLPPDRQSRGMAIAYSGASMGSLLAPLVVTPIALRLGWRAAFLFTGGLGLAWLAVWWRMSRPPWLPARRKTPLKVVLPNLRERRFWSLVLSYGFGAVAHGPVSYLGPLYLSHAMGLSQELLGKILWIPGLGWELGYFFWGWFADRYVGEQDRPVWVFLLLSVLALPVAFVNQVGSWPIVMVLFFWAIFVADGFIVMALRVGTRAYPREQTAMVGGIGSSSYAAMVAIVLPIYGRWFDKQLYDATFISLSLLPLLGTGLWWWLSHPGALAHRKVSA